MARGCGWERCPIGRLGVSAGRGMCRPQTSGVTRVACVTPASRDRQRSNALLGRISSTLPRPLTPQRHPCGLLQEQAAASDTLVGPYRLIECGGNIFRSRLVIRKRANGNKHSKKNLARDMHAAVSHAGHTNKRMRVLQLRRGDPAQSLSFIGHVQLEVHSLRPASNSIVHLANLHG